MLLSERLLFLPKEPVLLHRSLIWGFVAKILFDLSKTITILVHGLHSSRVFPGGNEGRSTHSRPNPPAISSVPLSSPEAFTRWFSSTFSLSPSKPRSVAVHKTVFLFCKYSFCLSVRNPHPKRSQDFTLTKRANTGAMGWAKGRPWNVRSKTPGRDLCLGEAQWTWRGTLQGDLRTVIRAQLTASPFQIQNRPGLSCWVQISRVILTSDCHDLKWVIWRLEMFWS